MSAAVLHLGHRLEAEAYRLQMMIPADLFIAVTERSMIDRLAALDEVQVVAPPGLPRDRVDQFCRNLVQRFPALKLLDRDRDALVGGGES